MTNLKTLTIYQPKIEGAETIEDILCLATLIGSAELAPNSTLEDAKKFYEEIAGGDCGKCLLKSVCLACIINE